MKAKLIDLIGVLLMGALLGTLILWGCEYMEEIAPRKSWGQSVLDMDP